MEIERSRNGFYTVTFINKNNYNENYLVKQFSSIGKVYQLAKSNNRVFIRFKHKDEAERAIVKFGKTLKLEMAQNNSNNSRNKVNNSQTVTNQDNSSIKKIPPQSTPKHNTNMNQSETVFKLILGNLPKNYTVAEVKALVEEADPLFISNLDETKAFHLKFCLIVLRSVENLQYLINKLDGFVISGQKLVAVEVENLLDWRRMKK